VIILGFVEELGIIQRLLHRSIARAIAGMDEDKIVSIARQAFSDHIIRSVKYGQRTERSVIFDYLVNRHMYGLPLEKVLDWFDKTDVSYYNSWPSVEIPFQINPCMSELLPMTHPIMKEYRALLRLRWLFTQKEDIPIFNRIAEIINTGSLYKQVDELSSIFTNLVQNQDGEWERKDLQIIKDLAQDITLKLNGNINKLQKLLNEELTKKVDAVSMVLENIMELQHKDTEEFNSVIDLFKELNGLGNLYLVGINNNRAA
jgi:hypothetical protein